MYTSCGAVPPNSIYKFVPLQNEENVISRASHTTIGLRLYVVE
jgi:hypothetical protein